MSAFISHSAETISLPLLSSVVSASDTVVTELHSQSWESLFLTVDSAASPELITAEKNWIKGLDAFAGSAIAVSDRENFDVWYRCNFTLANREDFYQTCVQFEGLATLADVWLNGVFLFSSDNMFLQHRVNIDHLVQTQNTFYIRIQGLLPKLEQRKPRPAWRTPFVNHKNLAWFRTSQIGRIPTWSPPPTIIGPWLPVFISQHRVVAINNCSFQCTVDGTVGRVAASISLCALNAKCIEKVELYVGEHKVTLNCISQGDDNFHYQAELQIQNVDLWWPHTHGQPKRYSTQIIAYVSGHEYSVQCEPLGFREMHWQYLSEALNTKGDFNQDFGLRVNGRKIFCRGACWTPINIHMPQVSKRETRQALEQLINAGVNMVRVSGTFYYEQEHFYQLCDELGILIWQDFMFARLAYPFDDQAFYCSAMTEATQILQRLQSRPSLAILCGNTEIEQQTTMLGLPLDVQAHSFFRDTLADLCMSIAPNTAYWPSSPAGGDLPIKITQGVSHYFGVGGYQRPLEDAQLNCPQFASECLAFSNVPENFGLKPFLPEQSGFPTHPDYKAAVPRDVSSGWDFADITDHYIERLFKVDTRQLRYQDPQRYFALSRIASGEVMSKVYGMWRRETSGCNGALIWFLRDLHKGSGWGLIDSEGIAKSVYFYLRRIWSPLALWFVDEGLNGTSLHLSHEQNTPLNVELEVIRYQSNGAIASSQKLKIKSQASTEIHWNIEALLGHFFDVNYAHRFGPREYTLIHARLKHLEAEAGTETAPGQNDNDYLVEAFYYPVELGLHANDDPELELWAEAISDNEYRLTISAKRFARAVAINAYPFIPDDNYFDLAPGCHRRITLRTLEQAKVLRGSVSVFNAAKTYVISLR